MPDEVVVPKPIRRKVFKPKPKPANTALREIDAQLTHAMQLRSQALHQVSELEGWQTKLARLTQEVDQLMAYRARLSGEATPTAAPFTPQSTATSANHSFQKQIPPDVGSIPSGLPKAGPGNLAEAIKDEGGFA